MAPAPPEDVRNGRKATLTPNDSGLFETARRFWQKSYAGDYLGLALLAAGLLLMKSFAEPFHTMFLLSDVRIQHPWAEVQRVDNSELFLYALGIPLLTITLWSLLFRRNLHKAHVTILGLVISIVLTSFITDIIKNAVGRPRPDLIARCVPKSSAPKDHLVDFRICMEHEDHKLHDGWRSFPSGHSSFAFAGLGWLSLFFASQMHVLRPHASLVTVLLCLAPLLGAAMIGISRLEDYRHDVFDVVCGSILGMLITYGNWRRYYPSLNSKFCDEPYSPPESGSGRSSSVDGYSRAARDEEEGLTGEEERFDDGGGIR